MRSRWAILASLLIITGITAAPALAASPHVMAGGAQSGSDAKAKASPEPTTSAKSGAAPAAKESGPPWTFQMARIIVFLSFILILAIFRWYWKLVGSRAKGTA